MIWGVGARRTGTNLLRAILGAHSQIVATPTDIDVFLMHHDISKYDFNNVLDKRTIYKELLGNSHLTRPYIRDGWDIDLRKLKTDINKCNDASCVIASLFINFFRKYSEPHWCHVQHSFEYANELEEIFPSPKYIYMYRNPLDVAASAKTHAMKRRKLNYNKNIILESCREINRCHQGYLDIVNKYDDDRILYVRYGDLVYSKELEIKRITDFLGLKFEPNQMKFNEHYTVKGGLPYYSNSSYKSKRDNSWGKYWKEYKGEELIYSSSVDKWKDILTDEEVELVKREIHR